MARRFGGKGRAASYSIVIVFALLYLGGMVPAALLPSAAPGEIPALMAGHPFVLSGLFCFLLLFFSAFSLVGVLVAALSTFFAGSFVATQVMATLQPFSIWALVRLIPLVCLLAPAFVLYSARCAASSLLLIQKLLQLSSDQQIAAAVRKQLILSLPIFLIVMATALLYQWLL